MPASAAAHFGISAGSALTRTMVVIMATPMLGWTHEMRRNPT
jgi:hypothetical protein